MQPTRQQLADYAQALDAAWEALEEAIVRVQQLNDQMYDRDGELAVRAPRADVSLIQAKLRELTGEVETFAATRAPSTLPPILPGEVRYVS